MDTKTVYGMLIGDGALVGVSDNLDAGFRKYWYGIEFEDEDWCLVQFTVPIEADVEGIVDTGDMYTDADNLLANCVDWVVMDCGDRPYMSPFFVWHQDSWHFANFDGSIGIEYWTPGDDVEDECEDDSFDEDGDY